MKKLIIALTLIMFSVNVPIHAQELVGKLYKAKVPVRVITKYHNENDPNWRDSICEAKAGYVFQVIDVINDEVIIRWWDFDEMSRNKQKKEVEERKVKRLMGGNGFELISYLNTSLNYEISLSDLNSKCIPYYGNSNSFTWGAVTMPVKLRFGNKSDRYFSFQEALNIGIAAGWSWQIPGVHQKSNNALLSMGVSNISLDELDFKEVNGERFKPNVKTTAAFTIAAGYVFQFEKFQAGVFTGIDMLPYDMGKQWLHRGKPWIGFGFGMSLFNRNQEQGGTGKNQDNESVQETGK
jgi:hypothetical protein